MNENNKEQTVTKEVVNMIFDYSIDKINFSRKEIANMVGVSASTVYRYQKLLGLV
jgi:DNA-directed RNA polymerase specialized sigma subunit